LEPIANIGPNAWEIAFNDLTGTCYGLSGRVFHPKIIVFLIVSPDSAYFDACTELLLHG
jgi:hypothetical protein